MDVRNSGSVRVYGCILLVSAEYYTAFLSGQLPDPSNKQ